VGIKEQNWKAMRLQVLSDLHLELDPYEPEATPADVVVLAGDIQVGCEGRKWAEQHFSGKPVIYVLGNHEFYHHSMPELTKILRRETSGSHIHLLENNAVEIDGFAFLGCTLWTDSELFGDPEAAMRVADQRMCDFSLIERKSEKGFFRPWQSAQLFADSVAWLKGEFSKHDPAKTIVVTHHAPSPRSIPAGYAGNVLSAAFASNLDDFIKESGVRLWIHGHLHHNVDYRIGKTRVYTNQRGYPGGLLPGFEPSAVIRV
jgi:Icc-related predicted phosphoesterase